MGMCYGTFCAVQMTYLVHVYIHMIQGLTGLCSASTPSLLTTAVQHVVFIVLATTSYCVDMGFHIVLYSLEQHSNTSTRQQQQTNKRCRNDWLVSVEPKYCTYRLLNDLIHAYNAA